MENKVLICATTMVLAASGCASLQTKNQAMAFYVENSDSIQSECRQANYREIALSCHRLVQGENTIVGIREYSSNELDRESFRKLTLVVERQLQAGDVIDVPDEETRAFYSTGLSFMPGKAGCYGDVISGEIVVLQADGEHLELELDLLFDLKSPLEWTGACQDRRFHSRINAKKLSIEHLGPWEGVRTDEHSLIEESVPNLD